MTTPTHQNFDIALQYASYSQQLKSTLLSEAVKTAEGWNTNISCWVLSKKAQTLANELFAKFCQDVRTHFPQLQYQEWLEMSIRMERVHFLPDLDHKIKACFPETV